MNVIYVCSPYRAKTDAELDRNIDYAIELTKRVIRVGAVPITPHLYITAATNDKIPEERAKGLEAGLELLKRCDAILIGDRYGVSAGMRAEIEKAKEMRLAMIMETEDENERSFTYGSSERYKR